MDAKNKLYFGDNLKILREYVPDASVDLIYLDLPFNSSATYNAFVAPTFRSARTDAHLKVGATSTGEESAAQMTAFEALTVAPIGACPDAGRDRRLGLCRGALRAPAGARRAPLPGGHRPPLQQAARIGGGVQGNR